MEKCKKCDFRDFHSSNLSQPFEEIANCAKIPWHHIIGQWSVIVSFIMSVLGSNEVDLVVKSVI